MRKHEFLSICASVLLSLSAAKPNIMNGYGYLIVGIVVVAIIALLATNKKFVETLKNIYKIELFGIRPQGDDLDPIREDAAGVLRFQYERGSNGYVKTKYVTLTIEEENMAARCV